MKRRYTITYNSMSKEVFPIIDKVKYASELEQDQIFKRKKFVGKLKFVNNPQKAITDFSFFADIELNHGCEEIKILIEKLCNGVWQEDWRGYFSTGGGSFDFDRCIFTIAPEPDDIYRCVFKNWGIVRNIFEVNVIQTGASGGVIETCHDQDSPGPCPCDLNPIPYVPCGALGYTTAQQMFDDGWCVDHWTHKCVFGECILDFWWIREILTVNCVNGVCDPPPDASWTLLDSCAGGTCKYVRCPNNQSSVEPIRGVLWIDTLNVVLRQLCSDLSHVSSIFFDFQPDTADLHYNQFGAGTNYVTQTINKVNDIICSQKSDVIYPTASNPATLGNYTVSQWLQWAREVFNVYWDITTNSNGDVVFRMEHYSFYNQQFSIDLLDDKYKIYLKQLNKYEHSKASIPQIEKFKWMDAGFKDMIGVPVLYSSACATDGNEVTHTPENLSTDIEYLLNNSNVSLEGFCLITCSLSAGNHVIIYEKGKLSNAFHANNHLSWANLHYNYHRYNRFLSTGNMNNVSTVFLSWRRNIKQDPINIPNCCDDVDPNGYALTELGESILFKHGFIDKMELDFSTNVLTLNLTYSI